MNKFKRIQIFSTVKVMENVAENDAEKNRIEKVTDTVSSTKKSLDVKILNKENTAKSTSKPEDEVKREYTRTQLLTLIVLSIATFCDGSCVAIQAPFFPTEAEKKGATSTQYGLIFGIYSLILFATSIVLGKITHYIRPKLFITLGLLIVGTSCIFFGTLTLVPDTTTFITLAFLVRIIEGVGSAALKTSCYIILATDFTENAGTATGIIESFFAVSFICGPTIGELLYDLGGYGLPFWTMGSLAAIDAIAICFFLPNSEHSKILEKGNMFKLWLHPRMMLCFLSIFTVFNYGGFNIATLGVHLRNFDLSGVMFGMMFSIAGLVCSITSPVWGWLCDKKYCSLNLLLLSSIGSVFSLLLLGPAPFFNSEPRIGFVIAALLLLGTGIGGHCVCAFVCALEDMLNRGIPQNRATLGALSSMKIAAQSLGLFAGPSVGGYLLDSVGYRNATMSLLLLETVLIIFLIVAICNKKSRIKETKLMHSIQVISLNERYIASDEAFKKNTRTLEDQYILFDKFGKAHP